MALPPEVCIRGAGIVGRTLALLLARERVRVALVAPKAAPGKPDIRAYALNAASRTLLESLRAWPDAAHATPVREMLVNGDEGGRVQFSAARQKVDALAWIVDVPALEQQLADAVRFQPQVEVVEAPVPAPLTVVCEGKASATREALGVSYQVTRYPQHAIAARLEAAQAHDGTARQWFNDKSEVLALLPMGGAQGRSLALVWSVDQLRAPELLALDDAQFDAAVTEASHAAFGALRLTSERAAWPLARAMADRWTGTLPQAQGAPQSWALAGDAAHTVHPLAGQGLNLGLADAAMLADVIKQRDYWRSVSDPRLLRRYERARRAGVLQMSLATDGLQQLFSHSVDPLPALRNWGMRGFDQTRLLKQWIASQAMGLKA
ncbi:2-polyprenyl-6-methoxyphenol hydroxylase-like FAD-dependent oxidoreductase [Variovorax sp. TBS-050B]|uniref:FAD-dependent monooxygenase n=1 Tax=Variovorax sp. TBS-050B TaxID=2940551 RepID=UPI002473C0BF|nr:FAD-dependent monooxygenase [Variovorax sp. TBS-050B]MDH6591401.1 2-polyprenyl-6-methoxyphenol hydroxylase-like FAD-dependent oxidoreductase [Variovorax sp. TBS-050B]